MTTLKQLQHLLCRKKRKVKRKGSAPAHSNRKIHRKSLYDYYVWFGTCMLHPALRHQITCRLSPRGQRRLALAWHALSKVREGTQLVPENASARSNQSMHTLYLPQKKRPRPRHVLVHARTPIYVLYTWYYKKSCTTDHTLYYHVGQNVRRLEVVHFYNSLLSMRKKSSNLSYM